MSFARYPAYKDSGVEWLGEVPAHWEVVRICDVAKVINGHPFDARLFDANGQHPLVRIRDLDCNDTVTRYNGEFLEAAAITLIDVLIGMDGDFNVGRWLGAGHALLNQRMCCVRTGSPDLTRLFRYSLPIPLKVINDFTYATTVKHLSSFQVEKTRVAFPIDPQELSNLVRFLDRETTKIDALVAEQETLMALLKEKRQAVISHAVTKGLDATAPMKDSGVIWLGEVPAHWAVQRVKHLVTLFEQGWSPQCENFPVETPNEWGVLKVGCVNGGKFKAEENKALPSDIEPVPSLSIALGDLLISRANTRELVGSAAIAKQDYPNLMLCDKLFRLRFDESACSSFFVACHLGTVAVRGQIELAATGASSSMVNIGQSTILELEIALPPMAEQESIVRYINQQAVRFDELAAEAQTAITLLQERRTALISAAVTGQIDVRHLVTTRALEAATA